jgi:hypothetical protein
MLMDEGRLADLERAEALPPGLSRVSWGLALGAARLLPGLRAVWGMAAQDEAGWLLDAGGGGQALRPSGTVVLEVDGRRVGARLTGGGLLWHAAAPFLTVGAGLTVGVWLKFAASGAGTVVGRGGTPLAWRLSREASGAAAWRVGDGATVTTVSGGTLLSGTWQWLVGRWRAGSLGLWLDGVQVAAGVGPGALAASGGRLEFGPAEASFGLSFLAGAELSDGLLGDFWETSRALYGR